MAVQFTTKSLSWLRLQQKAMMLPTQDMDPMAGVPLRSPQVDGASTSVGDLLRQYEREVEAVNLRSLRESNVWVHRCIQYIKEHIAAAAHSIMPIDATQAFDKELAAEIMEFLDHPNAAATNDSFGALWGMAYEDVATINCGAVQVIPWKDEATGEPSMIPAQLKAIDGSKVSQVPNWDPSTNQPRYKIDMGINKDPVYLRNDQLIVMDASPTTYSKRGIAPLRVLQRFILAEIATFKRMHLVQVQSTPGGVFILPGANPGTPDALAEEYEANVQGNAGVVFMNVPADSRYVEIGSADLEKQGSFNFYEVLVRGIATGFGLPPMVLGWYADVNRAYGQVASEMAYDGVENALHLLVFFINTELLPRWGDATINMRFTFDQLEVQEEAEPAADLRAKAGTKDFATIRDLRIGARYPQFDEGEVPAGALPFLTQLSVPVVIGKVVVQLPWHYFFEFMGVDPATGKLLPTSPYYLDPNGPPTTPAALPPGQEEDGSDGDAGSLPLAS